jgi:hypothetical protein
MMMILPPPSSAMLKNGWRYTFASPIRPYVYQTDNLISAVVRYVLSLFVIIFFHVLLVLLFIFVYMVVDTRQKKKKGTSKKNVDGRCTSSHENKTFRSRSVVKQKGVAFGFRKTATAVTRP